MEKKLMVVTEVKNFLMVSIVNHLEKASFQTTLVNADTDAINGVRDSVGAILIHADDKLVEQHQALYFIKDKATMDNIPIFAIGTPEELDGIKSVIPQEMLRQEFPRPLTCHVSVIVEAIDSYVRQNILQKKILVVDDSGPMLRTVKGWLEAKYSVFLANSGAMAIKYLALNRPDLILLDYEMPVADGRQVLEMIRAEPEFAEIPVVFLTKKGDPESIMNVKELHPEGYLLKSLTPAQIIKAVDEFFDKRKALL